MNPRKPISFTISHRLAEKDGQKMLGRTGTLVTPHGSIQTPAFVTVGTKGTVKSLTPEQVKSLGAQVVLANTYHLYLEPGEEMVEKMGGLGKMMQWNGPTMTDSGGFQVFSLGQALGKGVSKVATAKSDDAADEPSDEAPSELPKTSLAKIDEDGVTFKSIIDGSSHRFTPERAMEIQRKIGADMIFAFDECTSPHAPLEYQKAAMDRTHRWAKRCIDRHAELEVEAEKAGAAPQALFGVVQGGRHEDLRKESARVIGAMPFDGFGIGGSFNKEDMGKAVRWVNEMLPEEKPRHLLGIGDPSDLFEAVENGCDLFDCVAPTRLARNGSLYTKDGRVSLFNARFVEDLKPVDEGCGCYTCVNYSRAYLSHLFRANEMLAATLASIHNLYFLIHMVDDMREAIVAGTFFSYKQAFLDRYEKKKVV